MKIPEDALILKIYFGEHDKYKGRPLYQQIVLKAKELKLAGATVIKGLMGFGADSHLHTANLLRLSEDLPIMIEIVDSKENLDKLQPFLDETIKEGLITIEKVKVIKYRNSKE